MVQNDVDIHTEFVFNCNWILIQLQLNTNSVEYSNCIQLQRICIQWKYWMGLLNTYSVETEYVFNFNWKWKITFLVCIWVVFSCSWICIQLQLNTYSVAYLGHIRLLSWVVFSCNWIRIQLQLHPIFQNWHVYCAPDMVTRVSFHMDTWVIWIRRRRRRFRCFRRCCCWCWLAI